jgi:hypothetical protein
MLDAGFSIMDVGCSGWNRGDVRPRAQSPVAVAREDSRLGVEGCAPAASGGLPGAKGAWRPVPGQIRAAVRFSCFLASAILRTSPPDKKLCAVLMVSVLYWASGRSW